MERNYLAHLSVVASKVIKLVEKKKSGFINKQKSFGLFNI